MALPAGTPSVPMRFSRPLARAGWARFIGRRTAPRARGRREGPARRRFATRSTPSPASSTEARAVAASRIRTSSPSMTSARASGIHYAVTELLEGETLRDLVCPWFAARQARSRNLRTGRPRPRRCSREGNRPPRHQARERLRHEGRPRQDPRLRPGPSRTASTRGARTRSRRRSELTSAGRCRRDGCLHVARAGPRLAVDHRSDQFSLGVVLYEMLAGTRPFTGASAAETLTAIIREEPEPLSKAGVSRSRFRFAGPSSVPRQGTPRTLCLDRRPRPGLDMPRASLRGFSSGGVEPVLGGEMIRGRRQDRPSPDFQRHVRGGRTRRRHLLCQECGATVRAEVPAPHVQARHRHGRALRTGRPDGCLQRGVGWRAVGRLQHRLDALDPVPSGYAGANLLAISAQSQLALSLNSGVSFPILTTGRSLSHRSPGERRASWSPAIGFGDFAKDGEKAGDHPVTGADPLPGRHGPVQDHRPVRFTRSTLAFRGIRGLPRAHGVLLRWGRRRRRRPLREDHPPEGVVLFPGGTPRVPPERRDLVRRLPGGKPHESRAVTLGGHERLVLAAPVSLLPHHVAPDGRVLASTVDLRFRLFYRGEASLPSREFPAQGESGSGSSLPTDRGSPSRDSTLNRIYQCYLRSASGAPPVSLGPGLATNFSPDGRTLFVVQPKPPAVVLHPVGAGQSTTIRLDGFEVGGVQKEAGLLPGREDGLVPWEPAVASAAHWQSRSPAGSRGRSLPRGRTDGLRDDGASVVFSRRTGAPARDQELDPAARGRRGPGLWKGCSTMRVSPRGRQTESRFSFTDTGDVRRRSIASTGRPEAREFFREIGPADPPAWSEPTCGRRRTGRPAPTWSSSGSRSCT